MEAMRPEAPEFMETRRHDVAMEWRVAERSRKGGVPRAEDEDAPAARPPFPRPPGRQPQYTRGQKRRASLYRLRGVDNRRAKMVCSDFDRRDLSSPSRFLTHHKASHCRPPRTPEPTSTRTCRSPAAFVSSTAAPQLLHGATQKLAFRRRDNGLGSERLSSRRTGAQPQSRRRVTQQRLARPCRPI